MILCSLFGCIDGITDSGERILCILDGICPRCLRLVRGGLCIGSFLLCIVRGGIRTVRGGLCIAGSVDHLLRLICCRGDRSLCSLCILNESRGMSRRLSCVACCRPGILCCLSCRLCRRFHAAAELIYSTDKLVHAGAHSSCPFREFPCGNCKICIAFCTAVFRQEQAGCKLVNTAHISGNTILFIRKLSGTVLKILHFFLCGIEAAAGCSDAAGIGTDAVCKDLEACLHALDAASKGLVTAGSRTVYELCNTVIEGLIIVCQLLCAVRQGLHAVVYLVHAVGIFLDTVSELFRAVIKIFRAIFCFPDTVNQFLGAVCQIITVLLEIRDLFVHLIEGIFVIFVKFRLIVVFHFKNIGKDHGHAVAHLEVFDVHGDFDTVGNVQIIDSVERLLFVIGVNLIDNVFGLCTDCVQAVLQTREGHADDHGILTFGDNRSIVDFDI